MPRIWIEKHCVLWSRRYASLLHNHRQQYLGRDVNRLLKIRTNDKTRWHRDRLCNLRSGYGDVSTQTAAVRNASRIRRHDDRRGRSAADDIQRQP